MHASEEDSMSQMKTVSVSETVSKVVKIPLLSDAKLIKVERSDGGKVDYVELQVSHLVREYPESLADEKKAPSKKVIVSQNLVRFDREQGKLSVEYSQIGPKTIQDHTVRFRHFSPNFKWSVVGLMKNSKPFLQIFHKDEYQCEIDLSEEHGELATDEFFGWVGWDEDEDWFIYQAEALETKPKDYAYVPSFGEVLPTKRDLRIFVLDLDAGKIIHKFEHDQAVTPTQIVYVKESKSVYFVGYETLPKRYGMSYCINRPSHIHRWLPKENRTRQLTTDHQVESVHYPVYDALNGRILFMGTYAGGSHYHAFSLYALSLEDHSVKTLVSDESMQGREDIPGLFPFAMPQQAVGRHGYLFFTSYLRTQKAILSVAGSEVRIASNNFVDAFEEEKSWRILQVHEDIILAAFSSRSTPPRLVVGIVGEDGSIDWVPAIKEPIHEPLTSLRQEVYNVEKNVDIILTKPAGSHPSKLPLIIFPHGGPNFSYVSEYSLFSSVAASLGYSIAAVNYTGSAGYGQESIRKLEGQIGTLDVQDVLKAVDHLVNKVGYDKDNMFLYGGSHGGFLVTHLSCIPEYNFKACSAINAIVDMPGMAITSDIPDFSWGQTGLPFNMRQPLPPTAEELEVMRACSPSSRVHLAKTPTIILMGENDLRVPASQGIAWYTWLKARGIQTEAYMYPATGHAIDSPEGEFHEFVRTYEFFQKFL